LRKLKRFTVDPNTKIPENVETIFTGDLGLKKKKKFYHRNDEENYYYEFTK